MKYNFDEIIDRSKTNSRKWNPEIYKNTYNGKTDLLPLWVADMDFKVAPSILDSLQAILTHGILQLMMNIFKLSLTGTKTEKM